MNRQPNFSILEMINKGFKVYKFSNTGSVNIKKFSKNNWKYFNTLVEQLGHEHLQPDSTAQVLLHPSPPVTRSILVQK